MLKNRFFLAGFGLFGLVFQFCLINAVLAVVIPPEWLTTTAKTTPQPVTEKTETKGPKCESAGGRMWTGVRLHLDSDCSKPFATILGGGERDGEKMVKIRFDSGEIEWKTREAVRDQAFVMSNDPAMESRLWQEFRY